MRLVGPWTASGLWEEHLPSLQMTMPNREILLSQGSRDHEHAKQAVGTSEGIKYTQVGAVFEAVVTPDLA
jgi:hypothetical protein